MPASPMPRITTPTAALSLPANPPNSRRRGPMRNTADERSEIPISLPSPMSVDRGVDLQRVPSRYEPKYSTLFCGSVASNASSDHSQSSGSFHQSLFPEMMDEEEECLDARSVPVSNGCGALIHLRGVPKARLGVFTAKSLATREEEEVLAPLDARYFVDLDLTIGGNGSVQFVRSSCGCERIGIGCAVCGNPLGTRFKPCRSATTAADTPARHKNSRPYGPEGRGYWRISEAQEPSCPPQAASSVSSKELMAAPPQPQDTFSDFYVYTFFPSTVTSSPSFTFPPRNPEHHAAPAAAGSTIRTASPAPVAASSANMSFFVDPVEAPVISTSSQPTLWSSFAEDWRPPSPVRLSFVDPPSFAPRSMEEPQNVPARPWRRDGWPGGALSGTDEWDKDIWEGRMVTSGR
ncbi:hypothetical protein DL96DRAFT_977101 [Flagelloscypha sp. PMI_526]|nr:hypothetical protein DL96DRAFT_977101 [Flagelloscypha sp. PMI_526]